MKLFVWDFHGVLEKGNEQAVVEISNNVLKRVGYSQRFTTEDGYNLYGKKWFEYFEYILPEMSHEDHLKLQDLSLDHWQQSPKTVAKYIRPNDNAKEVIDAIAKNHQQILLSNTPHDAMQRFLDAVGLGYAFAEGFFVGVDAHRKNPNFTKANALDEFLVERSYDTIVAIGDSPHDIELAKKYNGISYLYSHPGKAFRDCESDHKINDLREILVQI